MARGLLGFPRAWRELFYPAFAGMEGRNTEDSAMRVLHPCKRIGMGNRNGKRSFRRAKQRALRDGRALYRGRWYKATQFQYSQTSSATDTSKRQKPLKCIRNAGEGRRAGRLKFFSWNSGGLTTGQFDELIAWSEKHLYDIVFVQETRWKNEFTWVCGSFLCLHSGENISRGNTWCGLLVLISKRLTNPSLVPWTSIITGRIMHVRIGDAQGTIDALNCYQQTPSQHVEQLRVREQVWHRLAQVLQALPLRNRLLMAGDFNAPLVSRAPWVGKAVPQTVSDAPDVLGDLAELFDLCALNSWQGKDAHTCVTMHGGSSCIDAVWTRRCLADSEARCTKTSPNCPLLFPLGACYHYPLIGSMPKLWQCWKRSSHRDPALRSGIDMEQLCKEAREQTSRWLRLHHSVQEALNSYLVFDVSAVSAEVAKLCSQAYPQHLVSRKAPFQDSSLTQIRSSKWKLWKELFKPCGAGLQAIVFRWWLVIRLQILSRLSSKRSKELRRQRLNDIYEEARRAAVHNDVRSLFRQVRRLAPKRPRIHMALRDESGQLLGPIDEGRKLHEHLTSIFFDKQAEQLTIPFCSSLPVDEVQLEQGIRDLPVHKAVPSHCLPSGVWKYLSGIVAPWLHRHLNQLWSACIPGIPSIWRSSWITLVPKPGKSGSQVEHWRPISLQESLGKATLKSLTREARDCVLPDLLCWPQYAYLPGRGTYDAISKVLLHCEEVRQLLRTTRSTIHSRRAGWERSECAGGIQILVDLKGAFDRAPRLLLQQALLDLPLPHPLLSLLLAWHHLTPYHLQHGGQQYNIDSNVGVRQGCVAAPLLWVAFMRFWMKYLSCTFGAAWVRKHLTVYADDNHLAWSLTHIGAVHEALIEALFVLKSFSEYGMHLNLGKTAAIMQVRGKAATSVRRRYVEQEGGQKFLRLDSSMRIPLVTHHLYLGMCVSYGPVARLTLKHRRDCSRKSFFVLRKWWSPSSLPLAKRINLWKICVWTSLCYSLVETGLSPPLCLEFQRAVYKDLRWIAKSPCHVTHETNNHLVGRLGLRDPLIMLARDAVQHWTKKWLCTADLPPQDVLHDRWLLLLTPYNTHAVLLWIQFCFYLLVALQEELMEDAHRLWHILRGLGIENMKNSYSHVLERLLSTDDALQGNGEEETFVCDLCQMNFGTLRGLRVHQSKVHEISSATVFGNDDQDPSSFRVFGVDGMPVCCLCHARFADWFAFDRHFKKSACSQALRRTPTSTLAPMASPSSDRTHVQRTDESPLVYQKELLDLLRQDWQHTLANKLGLREKLSHYCCLCNQWFAKGHHLTHHGHRQHRSLFEKGKLHRNELLIESGLGVIKWHCPYCLAVFQSANLHHCPVLLQIAVLLCAPSASSHGDGYGNRCCQQGNGTLQGAHWKRFNGRRWVRGARAEKEAHRDRPRYRLRTKSRPANIKWKIQRQTSSVHLNFPGSPCDPSRRQPQHIEARYRVCSFHEPCGSGVGSDHATCGRALEKPSHGVTNVHHKPVEVHHVEDVAERTADTSQAALCGRSPFQADQRGSTEERNPEFRWPVSVPPMGQRGSEDGCDRSKATVSGSDSERPKDSGLYTTSLSSSPLSFYPSSGKDHEYQDCTVHAGVGSEVSRCTSGMGDLRQILNECSDGPGGRQHETFVHAKVASGDGFEEDVGQVRQVGTSATSALFCPMLSLNSTPPSSPRIWEQPVRTRWVALLLENPTAVCYLNSAMTVLGWGILAHTDMLADWEQVGALMLELLRLPAPCKLYDTAAGSYLLQSWADIHRQHDVAELLGHVLERLELRKVDLGHWGAMYAAAGWIEYTMPLVHPLPLPLPDLVHTVSLQTLLNSWSTDGTRSFGIMAPLPAFFLVQLGRFIVRNGVLVKTTCLVTGIAGELQVPTISAQGVVEQASYQVNGAVLHYGPTPDSGHYICALLEDQSWWIKDDSNPPRRIEALNDEHCSLCYVLCQDIGAGGFTAGSYRTSSSTPSSSSSSSGSATPSSPTTTSSSRWQMDSFI